MLELDTVLWKYFADALFLPEKVTISQLSDQKDTKEREHQTLKRKGGV
jgi:hypothetical protein